MESLFKSLYRGSLIRDSPTLSINTNFLNARFCQFQGLTLSVPWLLFLKIINEISFQPSKANNLSVDLEKQLL